MKYNRTEIMRRAWEIKRSENVSMSIALVRAWAEAKTAQRKNEIIKRLENIVSLGNQRGNFYFYTLVANDWVKYGKNRTYFKIVEKRNGTRHYVEGDYGYFDNIAKEYVPGKKSLDWDFGGNIRMA